MFPFFFVKNMSFYITSYYSYFQLFQGNSQIIAYVSLTCDYVSHFQHTVIICFLEIEQINLTYNKTAIS